MTERTQTTGAIARGPLNLLTTEKAIEMAKREGDDLDDEAEFQYALKSLRKMLGSCLKILEEREKAQNHSLYALWVRARAMPGVDPVEVVRRYIQGTQETAAR